MGNNNNNNNNNNNQNHPLNNNTNNTNTPNNEDRMSQVLSNMKLLLARMKYGGNSFVNTCQFSKSLGLENDEMQDPNEFAKLLFDRMKESLSRGGSSGSGGGGGGSSGDGEGDGDGKELLSKLFRGICTYSTTCLTCHTSSTRNEDFTDLTLPIVVPPEPATAAIPATTST